MASDEIEAPLMEKEDRYFDEAGSECSRDAPTVRRKANLPRQILFYGFVVLPWVLLAGLAWWSRQTIQQYKSRYYIRPDLTYSPLQDVVKYETKIFTTGLPDDLDDPSIWAGEPSDEVDAAWKSLYPAIFHLIPQESAAKLVNKTVIFPHDEQRRYMIEVDVFHQLHCLNMVRKATRPDYYPPQPTEDGSEDPLLGPRHIAHCIDAIRQSLMCASDITVYTWKWDEEEQTLANKVKNPHTCHNFDALKQWSVENTVFEYPDFEYHELNDPLDPSTWVDR